MCDNQAQSRGTRSRNYGTLDAMKLYVQHLNIESKMLHERQLKERKDQLHLTMTVDAVSTPEPSGINAPDDTDGTTMNIPYPQIISSPNSQNITQTSEYSAPPIPEPSTQFSHTLPLPPSLPPTTPRADHRQGDEERALN